MLARLLLSAATWPRALAAESHSHPRPLRRRTCSLGPGSSSSYLSPSANLHGSRCVASAAQFFRRGILKMGNANAPATDAESTTKTETTVHSNTENGKLIAGRYRLEEKMLGSGAFAVVRLP